MGYQQYLNVTIKAAKCTISVENATLICGKFYASGDVDKEIPISVIDQTVVQSGQAATINSCGREDSPSGTLARRGPATLHNRLSWSTHVQP